MSVKKSIFGSRSEERGFRSIEHTWGEKYRIIPQFPWSAIFTPDPRWRDTSNLFFKTSVDYLLSTDEGQPLLAIDFDGMGRGYDRNGEYVQVQPTEDPYRKAKFDFKLQYARSNEFPYHIVASEEFNKLGNGIELTVVDSIIGSIIARQRFLEEVQSRTFADVNEAMDLEIALEIEHSPIIQKTFEVMNQISAITGDDSAFYRKTKRPFSEPDLPDFELPPWSNLEAFKHRLEAMEKSEERGCVVTLSETPVGEVSDVATVRNTGACVDVGEIAELLVYSKLLRLLKRKA
ncbi:MAG: hypothetical protein F4W95_11595 [Chloroflexi bacterium]|nr:hypothetical protein [Chloroflexota bacterium]MYD49110.1 hypothetical protein [Chloroflexota bacterium]